MTRLWPACVGVSLSCCWGAMNTRRQALHGASTVMEIKPYPGAGGFYADDN